MATYFTSEGINKDKAQHEGTVGLLEAYKTGDSHLWLPGEGAVTEAQLESFGIIYMIPENLDVESMQEDLLLFYEDCEYTGNPGYMVGLPKIGRKFLEVVYKELWNHIGWAEAESLPEYR